MEEVTHRGASVLILIPKYHAVDKIKENMIGGACGVHGRGGKIVQRFGAKAQTRDHLEDQGVDGSKG
jgi:hypothetical protein